MSNTRLAAVVGVLFVIAVILFGCLACTKPAAAAEPPFHVAAGVNGAWLDGPGSAFPVDIEAGATGWSSLSPHLSAVGGAWWGFSHSYARYTGGVRCTASDVLNPDFNTFLGVGYRGGSKVSVGPNEWEANAGFGWRVASQRYPNLTVAGVAGYGLTSSRVLATLGLRYAIPLN